MRLLAMRRREEDEVKPKKQRVKMPILNALAVAALGHFSLVLLRPRDPFHNEVPNFLSAPQAAGLAALRHGAHHQRWISSSPSSSSSSSMTPSLSSPYPALNILLVRHVLPLNQQHGK
ncbi:hypothetical protein OUZ56_000087 [Daphnia magna]|uniref:Uncharacterized protein n=1 Tax=Daphnia magna TaxID=35525 RepID=A0ABQ9ZYN8_9CRUS|nr:hypothetical protein OUZ56_000087 [Daphnia magna]